MQADAAAASAIRARELPALEMLFKPPLVIGGFGDRGRYPISAQVFSATSDKQEIYKLRYRAFTQAGWIAPDDTGVLCDAFDDLPTAYSIGAFYNGDCVGSLRLAFGGANGARGSMPCELFFPDETGAILSGTITRAVEFSRMAVDPGIAAKTFRAVIYASLVRAGLILTYATEADFAFAAVHRKMSRFYEIMCGFRLIAQSASYGSIAEPTHLLGRDLVALDRRRQARNPFFCILPEEIDDARDLLAKFESADELSRVAAAKLRA